MELDIQIGKVGKYTGHTVNGDLVEQNITEESLKKLEKKCSNREFLLDEQHKSFSKGSDHNEEAMGWLTKIRKVGDSLIAKLKTTQLGEEKIKDRVLRFISPVFKLDENNEPNDLINCGLVNYPAIYDMGAVLNSAIPEVQDETPRLEEHDDLTENEEVDMTKEEIEAMIEEIVAKRIEEFKVSLVEKTEPATVDEKTEVTNEVQTDIPSEPVIEHTETEVVSTEVKDEVSEEVSEETNDVIKETVLNSQPPSVDVSQEWRSLSGEAFQKWCRNHKHDWQKYC